MGSEEDPSWLSSLIDQTDRFILAIGGYEEASEHGFSDDESDSSEDEGDSETEEAAGETKSIIEEEEEEDHPKGQPRDEPDEKVDPEQSDAVPRGEKVTDGARGVVDGGACLTAAGDGDSSEDRGKQCSKGGKVLHGEEDPLCGKETTVEDEPQARARDESSGKVALEQSSAVPSGDKTTGSAAGGADDAYDTAARDQDSSEDRDERCSTKAKTKAVQGGEAAPLFIAAQEKVVASVDKATTIVVDGDRDALLSTTPARNQRRSGGLDGERREGGKRDDEQETTTGSGRKEVEQSGPRPLVTPARTRDPDNVDEGRDRRNARGNESAGQTVVAPEHRGIGASSADSMITPFRSRDRDDLDRDPPPAGILPGGGVGSRRMNRSTNRNAAPAGERAYGGLDSARQTRRPVDSAEEMQRPSSSPAACETPAENLGSGKTGKMRFSYVGDTTWLRPAGDSSESAPAVVGVASKSRASIPPTGASTAAEGGVGSESGGGALERASGLVVPSATAEASESLDVRRRSREEMDQQLGQDMIAAAYPEPETDSEADKLSSDSLEGPAGSDGPDAEELPTVSVGEAEEYSEEDNHPSNGQDMYISEQATSASSNEMLEERVASRDEDSSSRLETEKGAGTTVGAKRAPAEDSVRPQEPPREDWMYDAPEAFAPSKRGKTQPENPLAVMRHSARLDDAIHERQRKLEAMTANGDLLPERGGNNGGKRGLENGNNSNSDELATIPWGDQPLRPYDSPIVDSDLPAQQARELGRHGFDARTLIICSPFRRCLQTAGVVARTLGVEGVTVHLEIGERMDKVRKEIAELTQARAKAEEDSGMESNEAVPAFSYLDRAGMVEALGSGVRLEGTVGEQPPEDESGVEAKERFIATIARLRQEQLREGPVLVVAHGDTLNAAGESLASQIVFEANYCAWAVFDLNTHTAEVVDSYGIQMIPL